MADDHQPNINGGTSSMSFNGGGDGVASSSMENLMRKLGSSVTKQQILLQGTDDVNTYRIYGQDVAVVASTASGSTENSAGSNKVKINPAVKHEWEQKYYLGNIVASHRNGVFIAYVLKVRAGGVVRIINRKTAHRDLLKGFDGLVMDIAFAHVDEVLLACVDEIGTLHVFNVNETNGATTTTTLVKIARPSICPPTSQHRVIWCPYIPDPESSDDEQGDDVGKLLVVTHDNMAEMYCLDIITSGKPPNQELVSIEISEGYQVIPGHEKLITDAVFSPDGSALATACLDGEVRVFSVAISDDATPPKCLHKWKPHDGRPLSLLVFLDNYKVPQQQFWKFAITGANYNQEIKLWSCVSWTCLQTIRLLPPPDLSGIHLEPCLKASPDATSDFLVVSDINRKTMYVFNIQQDWEAGRAHFHSVSEFLLTSPCLSFTILEAGRRKCKKTSDGDNLREYTTGDNSDDESREEEETVACTFIRMYAVHTKALQELQIQYEADPNTAQPIGSISSVSQDEPGFRDALTDISVDTTSDVEIGSSFGNFLNKDTANHKPLLLGPEAFSASPRKFADLDAMTSSVSTSSSSFTQVTPVRDRDDEPSSYRSPSNSTLVQSTDYAPSPGSQTPKGQLTPSNIPLPPVTPGEEDLSSSTGNNNKYSSFAEYEGTFIKTEPSAFSSPRTTVSLDRSRESRNLDANSVKSSNLVDLAKSAEYSKSDFGTTDAVKALFAAASLAQSGSTSSSRSGSIEVDHILNRSQEQQPTRISPQVSQPVGRPEPQPAPSPRGPYDSTIWPKAPDVATEAKRLVTEVLQNSGADQSDIVVEDSSSANVLDSGKVAEQPEKDEDAKEELIEVSSGEENDFAVEGGSTNGHIYTQTTSSHRAPSGSELDISVFIQLQAQLSQLTSLLTSQQQELAQLRQEVKAQQQLLHHQQHQQLQLTLQNERPATSPREHAYLERIDAQINDLSISLGRQVDTTLARFTEEQKQKQEEQAVERTNSERQKHDRLATTIATQVATATAGRIDKTLKQEMKTNVVPAVGKILEPIKEQLHIELAQKLTATDQLMRESINKMVSNKATIETIGQAAGVAVQGQIQAAYRDTVQNLITPSFERCCQEMYRQINDAFMKGTKEYQSQVENQTERLRKKLTAASTQLQQNVDNIPKSTQELQLALTQTIKQEINLQLKEMTQNLNDAISQHVKQVVRQEIDSAMKLQQDTIQTSVMHAIRSSAATPLPAQSPDPVQVQASIQHLLQQGHFNAAFQQALSAVDLNLVLYVCETVNPQQLFGQDPCPLQQPVLLSLIQQLSADLTQKTELQHRFLQEAIMNLDPTNHITREHMPAVLTSLCAKFIEFIHANPTHKMTKQMRMLLMASQSLHQMQR